MFEIFEYLPCSKHCTSPRVCEIMLQNLSDFELKKNNSAASTIGKNRQILGYLCFIPEHTSLFDISQ